MCKGKRKKRRKLKRILILDKGSTSKKVIHPYLTDDLFLLQSFMSCVCFVFLCDSLVLYLSIRRSFGTKNIEGPSTYEYRTFRMIECLLVPRAVEAYSTSSAAKSLFNLLLLLDISLHTSCCFYHPEIQG